MRPFFGTSPAGGSRCCGLALLLVLFVAQAAAEAFLPSPWEDDDEASGTPALARQRHLQGDNVCRRVVAENGDFLEKVQATVSCTCGATNTMSCVSRQSPVCIEEEIGVMVITNNECARQLAMDVTFRNTWSTLDEAVLCTTDYTRRDDGGAIASFCSELTFCGNSEEATICGCTQRYNGAVCRSCTPCDDGAGILFDCSNVQEDALSIACLDLEFFQDWRVRVRGDDTFEDLLDEWLDAAEDLVEDWEGQWADLMPFFRADQICDAVHDYTLPPEGVVPVSDVEVTCDCANAVLNAADEWIFECQSTETCNEDGLCGIVRSTAVLVDLEAATLRACTEFTTPPGYEEACLSIEMCLVNEEHVLCNPAFTYGGKECTVTLCADDTSISIDCRANVPGFVFENCQAFDPFGVLRAIPSIRIAAIPATPAPTFAPTTMPVSSPTVVPTDGPTNEPTDRPTDEPTYVPTNEPTGGPTNEPTDEPTNKPTGGPTNELTDEPTYGPVSGPAPVPTAGPTNEPTNGPTNGTTGGPTDGPTGGPMDGPSSGATDTPTNGPTADPMDGPSGGATATPAKVPTRTPSSASPFAALLSPPTISPQDDASTGVPTGVPMSGSTDAPTGAPASAPSSGSTDAPTGAPADAPTDGSTGVPMDSPSGGPAVTPTAAPSSHSPVVALVSPTISPQDDAPADAATDGSTDGPTTTPSTASPFVAALVSSPSPTISPQQQNGVTPTTGASGAISPADEPSTSRSIAVQRGSPSWLLPVVLSICWL
jgi:hypothetical protein